MDETELRERLRERHIDLCLRRNDTGRITGATFIDHETRCVFNGSRLGKAFSANALHERFAAGRKRSPNSCGSRGAGRKFGRHIPRAGNSIA